MNSRANPADPIRAFVDYLVAECGLASSTAAAYDADLRLFGRYLAELKIGFPRDVDRHTVVLFLGWCRDHGHANRSIRRYLAAIRHFYRFLSRECGFDKNPANEILLSKDWEKLPAVLTKTQVEALIAAPLALATSTAIRDVAMLELLYSSGMRVSELCNLETRNCHFEDGYLRCTGKGGKQRIVPINRRAREHVSAYLDERRQRFGRLGAPPVAPNLFVSVRGRPLGRELVFRLVKRCAAHCGLPKHVSPHSLRHTFATHLLAGGANLRVVQELLGHADIRTTEIYTHVDRSEIASEYRKYHPRA